MAGLLSVDPGWCSARYEPFRNGSFRYSQRSMPDNFRPTPGAARAAAVAARLGRPRARRPARRHRPDGAQRHDAAPRPGLPGRLGPRPRRPLPARGRREAAAAAARRRRGGRRRGRAAGRDRRSRGSRRRAPARSPSSSTSCPTGCDARSRRCDRPAAPVRPTPASDAEDPAVDAAVLSDLAAAIRDHQGVRCYYRDEPLELQPYHLVTWQRRWYLARTRPSRPATGRRTGSTGCGCARPAAGRSVPSRSPAT